MPALPSSVRLERGAGGLPVVRVSGPAATAEIYLHGAHLTAWTPRGHDPVLWMSAKSRFTDDSAIRGGVPICFPWFAALAGHADAPSHGFARLTGWTLAGARDDGENVVVELRLSDTGATRASAWPHRFDATYTVVVGERLSLSLRVTNRDDAAVTFEEALHTYFAVRDIRTTEVTGLEGRPFVDRLAGSAPRPGESHPVHFTGETDRIYLDASEGATVRDGAAGRSVLVSTKGAASTVVWNPWVEKARAMEDFDDDEWTGMVCVETCNIRATSVRLAPGESHTMVADFEVAPLTWP